MRVLIGSDHAGFLMKEELLKFLRSLDSVSHVEEISMSASSPDHSVDYPDVAAELCKRILDENDTRGVLVCGTGVGISIAANKFPGIRCALVHDAYTARMARRHNNANVIAFGGRVIGTEVAKDALGIFLHETFEGGRHSKRIDKIT